METNNAAGGQNTEGSANSGETIVETKETKVVKPEDHKRAIDDLHKFKGEAQTLKAELDKIRKDSEDRKIKEEEAANNFKSLYEQQKQKYSDLESKHKNLNSFYVKGEKRRAAQAEVLKMGLRQEALKYLDREEFDDIEMEFTSHGNFITHGADLWADKFKRENPILFQEKKTPNVNTNTGSETIVEGERITPQMIVEMEKKDPAKAKILTMKYLEERRKKTS